ncbi:hypothetical protein AB0N23_04230 [Streptomyces sp. NPDC052644]
MNDETWSHSEVMADLPLPQRWPAPVGGCADCAALAVLRGGAWERGDLSALSDCDVLLRRHAEAHR